MPSAQRLDTQPRHIDSGMLAGRGGIATGCARAMLGMRAGVAGTDFSSDPGSCLESAITPPSLIFSED